MRILITGAQGQLGYHLKQVFQDDELYLGDVGNLDIVNSSALSRVFRSFQPELVIHGAAYTAVDRAEDERAKAYAVNRDGSANLAKLAREYDIPMLMISTDYVFDGKAKRPYRETTKPKPLSVYGASKVAGEQAVAEITPKHWIVRTAWLFGGGREHRNFVRTMLELARSQKVLNVVNDQIGSPTYAHDLALALRELVNHKLPYGVWHIANSGSASWAQFAQEILKIKGLINRVKPMKSGLLKRKALRPSYSVLNCEKARKAGIMTRPWQEALADFLRHE
ncbi:dTDP-4-dehydrorhamnose reductase [Candidatus Berkelbacteria bacterium]|nr:dTDP-4-dehydrorhamnose reductase [Candidatus Berkelbacteria bacterium]